MTPSDTADTLDDTPPSTPAGTQGPPTVGLKEAARVAGVSVATVRRRREQLVEYGATASEEGWAIPIPALVAVGLLDRSTPPREGAGAAPAPTATPTPATPEDPQLEALREQLDAERRARTEAEHRARLAEVVAEERGRALEDARLALRALTAGPAAATHAPPSPAEAPPAAAQPSPVPQPHPAAERPREPRAWWGGRRRS